MRPSSASRRCRPMIEWMYLASRSPRLSNTSSWICWNSSPSCSICSGVRRLSGLWICGGAASAVVIWICFTPRVGRISEFDLDGTLGRVHANAAGHALGIGYLAAAKVAQLAGPEAPDAGVADAHAAAERQLEPGLLARDQDRRAAVALHL